MNKFNSLVATTVLGATALVSQLALPAAADAQAPATAAVKTTLSQSGTLYIEYRGSVVRGMAGYLDQMMRKYGDKSYKVVLGINSQGGSVEAGEQAIQALKRIKQTHRLVTVVLPGHTCASMCVPIYLQGQERLAARSSLWLFHEAAKRARNGAVAVDHEETLRLYRRYFVPAGVSVKWLNAVLRSTRESNLWQTGEDLINVHSGIVTKVIGNVQKRNVVAQQSRQ